MKGIAFHEAKTHGTTSFPYIVYKGDIPQFNNSFPLHWHDETEFIFVTEGCGIITVQSDRYEVSTGDIIVIPPQTVHAIDRKANCAMKYFNILFSLSMLDSADDICHKKFFEPLYRNELTFDFYIENGKDLNKLLVPHITRLIENRRELCQNGELLIKSELFAILHHLIAYAKPNTEYNNMDLSNYDKLKKLLLYVRDHYGEHISVKTAADICAYSESHFMKIFKQMTGQSFTEYLVNFRLNIAANALALSSDRIIDIAYDCGFGNLSYFSRAFLHKYGISPSQYRKSTTLEE